MRRIRELSRRARRDQQRRFVIEGAKSLAEALQVVGCVDEVFVTERARQDATDILGESVQQPRLSIVDERALTAMAGTGSPQGVLAACHYLDHPLEEVFVGEQPTVICADVRDPGNAGTIIRTADAVAAAGVVLAGDSVDMYNEKTVRSTVGSLFHLPVTQAVSVADAVAAAKRAGRTVLAADGRGDLSIGAAKRQGLLEAPIAWLFGNEAHGLVQAQRDLADHIVYLPLPGKAESLNLSVAAGVCLYESLI